MVGGPSGGRRDDWVEGGSDWVRPLRASRGPMPGGRPRRPRGMGRRPGLSGARLIRLPAELPTWPTVLAGVTAVVLAFIIGRATGGGEVETKKASAGSTTTSSTTTAPVTHTVGRGESLAAIAAQYGLTTEQLAEYNGITNLNLVRVGQVLQIPPR